MTVDIFWRPSDAFWTALPGDGVKRKAGNILIVDDEREVTKLLCRILNSEGYECVETSSAEAAVGLLKNSKFDVVLTDIMMPGMSGIDLVAFITSQLPDVQVIMVTCMDDRQISEITLDLGASGYLTKPFQANEVITNVALALERRRLKNMSQEHEAALARLIQQQTQVVDKLQEEMVLRLLLMLGMRNDETRAHARRVGHYAALVARSLLWEKTAIDNIKLAAQLHDIGKVGIPEAVLLKREKLTPAESALMKKHTIIGAQILDNSEMPILRMAREIALSHHEKWDGSGYPHRLPRESIPESARIVAVADIYDTLTHDQMRSSAVSERQAINIMKAYQKEYFDPRILDYFVSLLPQMQPVREIADD